MSNPVMSVAEVGALVWLFDGSHFRIGGSLDWIIRPLLAGGIYYYWLKSEMRKQLASYVPKVNLDLSDLRPPAELPSQSLGGESMKPKEVVSDAANTAQPVVGRGHLLAKPARF